MLTAALIPCRKGSKGIPEKNFKDFYGKPLWQWSCDQAIKSGIFDKIIVSSDNEELKFCGDYAIPEVIIDYNRPPEFATDEATLDDLLLYYMRENTDVELWCLLQPTSPLRKAMDIRHAYKKVLSDKYGSLVSVTPDPGFCWIDNSIEIMGQKVAIATYHFRPRPNRQQRKDWYKENGAIYFTKRYALDTTGHRLGGHTALYVMPKERSIEIDDKVDWYIAEALMKGRNNGLA